MKSAAELYESIDHSSKLSLYLHFPYCVRKCRYCDFLSAPADPETRQMYVEALVREISAAAAEDAAGSGGRCSGRTDLSVDSIFFGGGTPSLMTVRQMDRIMTALAMHFTIDGDAEITAECNPGTADREKLGAWRKMGINRLSLGVQSFDDPELQTIGRIHTAAEAVRAFEDARSSGFLNISLDLMEALPGQTEASFEKTLRRAAELAPEHLSVYSLIIEENTPFHDIYGEDPQGKRAGTGAYPPLPDEDTEREMYHRTKTILQEQGYRQYEISNYAKPGMACAHNIGYWKGHSYLGFGTGAASYVNGVRFRNTESTEQYISAAGRLPREEIQTLSEQDRMEEFMFLGLRMTEGVSEAVFREAFGKTMESVYGGILWKQCAEGLLRREDGRVFLTERGIDISNTVMADYLF